MSLMKLSQPMILALQRAIKSGAVFAGTGASERGAVERHSAKALQGLERRGLLTLHISPDGGTMGRPTAAGLSFFSEEVQS